VKLDQTFTHFLLEHQLQHQRTLNFLVLMDGIRVAAKHIQHYYNIAALSDNLGETDRINVQGEQVMALDDIAHDIVVHYLRESQQVIEAISEEAPEPIRMNEDGRYFVYFDPLDGSSNVKHNLPVGFLFGIAKRNPDGEDEDCSLRCGRDFIAAGMFLIPAGVFTFALRDGGAWRFLKDEFGEFVRPTRIFLPEAKKTWELSCNAGYMNTFSPAVQGWLGHYMGRYKFRYAGSLVVDFHRLLDNGGIFAYPPIVNHQDPSNNRPEGKLRLMYESAVVAFIAKEAGGLAVNQYGEEILDVVPQKPHQRSALFVGNQELVRSIQSDLRGHFHDIPRAVNG